MGALPGEMPDVVTVAVAVDTNREVQFDAGGNQILLGTGAYQVFTGVPYLP